MVPANSWPFCNRMASRGCLSAGRGSQCNPIRGRTPLTNCPAVAVARARRWRGSDTAVCRQKRLRKPSWPSLATRFRRASYGPCHCRCDPVLRVIANWTGYSAMLLNPHTRVLSSPGDAAALAAALERLRREPALRQRLGRVARALVLRQHTWAGVARRILRFTWVCSVR
jgi:hypothetical protein